MGGEDGNEAGVPGVGNGGRGGGAGGATETRGASSKVVSIASSARKVSSDAISLSHWANERPEGSGRGQGADDPGPIKGEGVHGAEEVQWQVRGMEDPGHACAMSQPPPLLALPDPGKGEGVGGQAHGGDVGGE